MVFITGRKDSLRVVKPAFKEQIWSHRLENAQITNRKFFPSFSQHFPNIFPTMYLKYFEHKSAQSKEIRVWDCWKCSRNQWVIVEIIQVQADNISTQPVCRISYTYVSRYVFCWNWILRFSCTLANGHIMLNTPVLVRSLKLSNIEPSQYLDGWPPGNTGCCWLLNSFAMFPIFVFVLDLDDNDLAERLIWKGLVRFHQAKV